MPAPFPIATNYSGNITGILEYNNVITGDMFGILMVLAVFSIFFISMKKYSTERAITASAFITSLFAYFFFVLGLIGAYIILIPTIITFIGLLLMFAAEKEAY